MIAQHTPILIARADRSRRERARLYHEEAPAADAPSSRPNRSKLVCCSEQHRATTQQNHLCNGTTTAFKDTSMMRTAAPRCYTTEPGSPPA
jgi:hypothetical protein